jgi:hypothetical protein
MSSCLHVRVFITMVFCGTFARKSELIDFEEGYIVIIIRWFLYVDEYDVAILTANPPSSFLTAPNPDLPGSHSRSFTGFPPPCTSSPISLFPATTVLLTLPPARHDLFPGIDILAPGPIRGAWLNWAQGQQNSRMLLRPPYVICNCARPTAIAHAMSSMTAAMGPGNASCPSRTVASWQVWQFGSRVKSKGSGPGTEEMEEMRGDGGDG